MQREPQQRRGRKISRKVSWAQPAFAGMQQLNRVQSKIGLHIKDGEFDNTKYKIVYVAPMKALVAEVVGNSS